MANKKTTRNAAESHLPVTYAYYGTVGLFMLGWVISGGRVWGFNWWAYQPPAVQAILVLTALAAGPLLWIGSRSMSSRPDTGDNPAHDGNRYWAVAVLGAVTFVGACWVLPAKTHFLGDGYQVLARLAAGAVAAKPWDYGATALSDLVLTAVGGPSEKNALLTFRLIASGAGLLSFVAAAIVAGKLFRRFCWRVLFLLGVMTGGYGLQFFGYVENYSLFVTMVLCFALTGLLAALGRIPRWTPTIPAAFAIFFHWFGIVLLPSLIYLLFYDSAPANFIVNLGRRRQVLIGLAIVAVGIGCYQYLRWTQYFFQFAFLPLLPDQFTVDSDYLLSAKHISDFLNLMIMLSPGVGVLLVGLWGACGHRRWSGVPEQFLLIFLVSAVVCIYVFNPGIGMPRNWDLFALPGIPLAVLLVYSVLSGSEGARQRFVAGGLAVVLAFLVLIPRVISQRTPEIAIAHFKNYVELDRTRNRNSRSLLTEYYRKAGDLAAAEQWNRLAQADFPEADLTNRGKRLVSAGDYRQAEALFRRALEINPIFVDAYSNLATCLMNTGRMEEADEVLALADGLNPLNATVANNRGTLFLRQGDLVKAGEQFREALRIEPGYFMARVGLVSVCVRRKDDPGTMTSLEGLRGAAELSGEYFQNGTQVCLDAGLVQSARLAYGIAQERGASESWSIEMAARYPELGE